MVLKQTAFDLELSLTGEKTIQLKDLKGQIFILYFYPKDSTPGCTQQGKDFTLFYKKFKKRGVEVFGISRDSLSSHEKFKKKENYSFDLISDEDGKLCKAFDVLKQKSMFGKSYTGIVRSTFVISQDLTVKKAWRNVKVKGHVQEVFDFIKTL